MNIESIITKRFSPRAFDEKQVSKEKLNKIFNQARLAPSAYNSQPWRFVLLEKNTELYKIVFDSLVEFNQLWAKNAPYLVLTLAKNKFEHNGADYNHSWYDLGQAVAYLTLAATEEGLVLHQMSGFDADKVQINANVGNDFNVVSVIAIGYEGDESVLPEQIRKMENQPRVRKDISEILLNTIPIK